MLVNIAVTMHVELNLEDAHYVIKCGISVQYWLRLENRTNNIILNNAYNCVKQK